MNQYRDLVALQEAIESGEEPPLPPLEIETADPYYFSLSYELDRFGKRGPREVITGPMKIRMIPHGKSVLINELYADVYCTAITT